MSDEYVAAIFRSEEESKQERSLGCACCLLRVGFSLGLFFDLEDGGDMLLRIVG
jgi:hypothetical protein